MLDGARQPKDLAGVRELVAKWRVFAYPDRGPVDRGRLDRAGVAAGVFRVVVHPEAADQIAELPAAPLADHARVIDAVVVAP